MRTLFFSDDIDWIKLQCTLHIASWNPCLRIVYSGTIVWAIFASSYLFTLYEGVFGSHRHLKGLLPTKVLCHTGVVSLMWANIISHGTTYFRMLDCIKSKMHVPTISSICTRRTQCPWAICLSYTPSIRGIHGLWTTCRGQGPKAYKSFRSSGKATKHIKISHLCLSSLLHPAVLSDRPLLAGPFW